MPAKKSTKKATKKTTAKKAVAKETVEVKDTIDFSKPIELNNLKGDELAALATHLEQLKGSVGWRIMQTVMQDNMTLITKQIVEKVDLTGQPLSDADIDSLRIEHAFLKQLLAMPDELIGQFKPSDSTPQPQYDPYSGTGVPMEVLSMSEEDTT